MERMIYSIVLHDTPGSLPNLMPLKYENTLFHFGINLDPTQYFIIPQELSIIISHYTKKLNRVTLECLTISSQNLDEFVAIKDNYNEGATTKKREESTFLGYRAIKVTKLVGPNEIIELTTKYKDTFYVLVYLPSVEDDIIEELVNNIYIFSREKLKI